MTERWAEIEDWAKKQHYQKGRTKAAPPWIKLHRALIGSQRFQLLPLASKALAPQLWLLAANNDGRVNIDIGNLEWELRGWRRKDIEDGLTPLIDKGYLIPASDLLADCQQPAMPEIEGETETDKIIVSLGLEFWSKYQHPPNRGAKSDTIKRFNKLPADEQEAAISSLSLHSEAIAATRKTNKDFNPCMASVFVNQKRWEGLIEAAESNPKKASLAVVFPDNPAERAVCEALIANIGEDHYASWFQEDGRAIVKQNGAGFFLVCKPARREIIEQRFRGDVKEVSTLLDTEIRIL